MTGIHCVLSAVRRATHTVSVAGPITGTRTGTGTTTSAADSVTITGGVGPFTYSRSYVSGDNFTITSPTGVTSTYSKLQTAPASESGIYRVTVTDTGNGNVTASADYTVSLTAT